MEQAVYKQGQFSTPKMEEIFKVLFDVSEGNNIMLKKNIVELVEHAKISIEEEVNRKQKEISDNNQRIAELESALHGLKIHASID